MQKINEISILSGKGGTGKTSLAAALATMGKNTVAADCDVDVANLYLILNPDDYKTEKYISGHKAVIDYDICTQCGLCKDHCRFGAIELQPDPDYPQGKITIVETSCDGCWLCSRICPVNAIEMVPSDKSFWYLGEYRYGKMVHARLAPGEENSGKLVSVVREQARKTADECGAKNIIIDGPPGTGCAAIASLTGANKVVIVTEPTGTGLHDMKRILDLAGRFQVKRYVVINKSDLNPDITDRICSWCEKEGVPVIGNLPFDPRMVHSMVACKSIQEWAPDSEIAASIQNIYELLVRS